MNLFLECWQLSLPEKELEKALCCNQPCKKDLPFCKHYCKAICHKGPCPEPSKCRERVTVRCRCRTRSETWECARAQEARKALGVKDTGYLALLECDEKCRERREAEELARKEKVERERRMLEEEEEEEMRAAKANANANKQSKKKKKRETNVDELKGKESQKGMQKYAKVSIGVGLIVLFIALIVYVTSNSY